MHALCRLSSVRSALVVFRPAIVAVALVSSASVMVGCKSSESGRAPVASREVASAPMAGSVTGMVYLPGGGTVPRGSELTVKLVDATVSGANVTVVEMSRRVETLPPYAFTLKPKAGQVKPDRVYHVEAVIRHKDETWSTTHYDAVLTGGTPSYVEIALDRR